MTHENKMYKCGFCGSTYHSIEERMKCEQTCLAKQEIEAKKAAEAKKQEEQNVRKAELDLAIKQANEAIDHANKIMRAYVSDYGSYGYYSSDKNSSSSSSSSDFFWPNGLSHHFWF